MAERVPLPSPESIAFGNRLRELREQKNLSLEQVGAGVGVGRSMVFQYEAGTSLPTVPRLAVIAKFFGCTTDYLLYGKRAQDEDAKNLARLAAALRGMTPDQVDALFRLMGVQVPDDESGEQDGESLPSGRPKKRA